MEDLQLFKSHIINFNTTRDNAEFSKIVKLLPEIKFTFASTKSVINSTLTDKLSLDFVHTDKNNLKFLIAFTDDEKSILSDDTARMEADIFDCIDFFEASVADGLYINPFSSNCKLYIKSSILVNEIAPFLLRNRALKAIEDANTDEKLLTRGSLIMQTKTIPAEFFNNSDAFIHDLQNNKEELIRKHLMISQVFACRQQDAIEKLTDEKQAKERVDRVLVERGKRFVADDYFVVNVSDESPKMQILDFPIDMQTSPFFLRLYFMRGNNNINAIYTVEVNKNKSIIGEINHECKFKYVATVDNNSFDESKKILELFNKKLTINQ